MTAVPLGLRPLPLAVTVDDELGGRWTSLRGGGREWLWTNPDADTQRRRRRAQPGDAFVDAGGVEECFPTVRGLPDHGSVWSRPLRGAGEPALERHRTLALQRSVQASDGVLRVDYRVTGTPGASFLHAVHALLDLTPDARIEVPGVTAMIVLDQPEPGLQAPGIWPAGLDLLGPDDGSATCVLLPGCRQATVIDGDDRLDLAWSSGGDADHCSMLLWRNLGGWPQPRPYRSIGIEPMVGLTADLSRSRPGKAVTLGPTGEFRWSLTLSAFSRS